MIGWFVLLLFADSIVIMRACCFFSAVCSSTVNVVVVFVGQEREKDSV
jgi:hypothetical protein